MVYLQLMVVKAGPVKRIFAPYKGERLSTLSWDPPPTPPGVRKRRAAEMAAAAFVSRPSVQQQAQQHNESTVLPGPPVRGNATEHTQQAAAQQQQVEEEQVQQAEASASSSDEGVVDFMSDDDEGELHQPDANKAMGLGHSSALSRFDDSEEEELQDPPQQAAAAAGNTAQATAAIAATDLSRFDDSDDEDPQLRQPSTQAAAATAAAAASDPSESSDSDHDADQLQQPVTSDSQKQQEHADELQQQPAASGAAASDLSTFEDGNVEGVADDLGLIMQPTILSYALATLAPVIKVGSDASPAPATASEPAALCSASDPVTSQHDSSSDDAETVRDSNQQKSSDAMALLRQPQLRQHPVAHKKATMHEQDQQSLNEPTNADVESDYDSEMESEAKSKGESDQRPSELSDGSGELLNSRAVAHSVFRKDRSNIMVCCQGCRTSIRRNVTCIRHHGYDWHFSFSEDS